MPVPADGADAVAAAPGLPMPGTPAAPGAPGMPGMPPPGTPPGAAEGIPPPGGPAMPGPPGPPAPGPMPMPGPPPPGPIPMPGPPPPGPRPAPCGGPPPGTPAPGPAPGLAATPVPDGAPVSSPPFFLQAPSNPTIKTMTSKTATMYLSCTAASPQVLTNDARVGTCYCCSRRGVNAKEKMVGREQKNRATSTAHADTLSQHTAQQDRGMTTQGTPGGGGGI